MYKKISIATFTLSSILLMSTQVTKAESITPSEDLYVKNQRDVTKAIEHVSPYKDVKNYQKYYKIQDVQTDHLNYKHYTLYPKHNKHIATDREIKVHTNPEGRVTLINGDLSSPAITPSNTIHQSKQQALNVAFSSLNLTAKEVSNGEDKVVRNNEVVINGQQKKYVYDIELTFMTPEVGHWHIQVDAETGKIVTQENLSQEAATTGTGVGVRGDKKQINITQSGSNYQLKDATRNGALSAYRFNPSTDQANLITNTDTTFNAPEQRPGVDANVNAAKVYDYFKDTFNRDSYDGQGSPIMSVTHVNTFNGTNTTNNAAWLGDKMIYGDGDNSTYISFAGADDIIAHELTHGLTQETAQLGYSGQTGALNESFSDVFAYFMDNEDDTIGEDVFKYRSTQKALRSMKDPTLFKQPAHMDNYVKTSKDSGGIHTNSGIPNKAAYLATQQLGQDQAEQIYYRALTEYLPSNAQFTDAKRALEQSALDLYGEKEKNTITEAWSQVGVK